MTSEHGFTISVTPHHGVLTVKAHIHTWEGEVLQPIEELLDTSIEETYQRGQTSDGTWVTSLLYRIIRELGYDAQDQFKRPETAQRPGTL